MSETTVFERYAEYYDLFYAGKNYESECDFLEAAWAQFGQRPRSVLDLAGGTGSHGVVLARRGYEITGLDRAPGMLSRYAQKAQKRGLSVQLHQGDLRDFALGQKFDAIVCLFDAACYLTENADLRAFFARVREHLNPGGTLIFDVWHAPPLLRAHDPVRVREVSQNNLRALRVSTTTLHTGNQLANVEFQLLAWRDGTLEADFSETHTLRYFSARELSFIVESCGFQVRALCPAWRLQDAPSGDDWHLAVVATAE